MLTVKPYAQTREVTALAQLPDPRMTARQVQALRAAVAIASTPPVHLSYRVYAAINQKSRSQTVRDLFVKLLVQVRGVGVERAAGVVAQYPTMSHLLAAYAALPAAGGGASAHLALLADVPYGQAPKRRKLGPVASASIAEAVWATTPP
jgi:hypothetical protein